MLPIPCPPALPALKDVRGGVNQVLTQTIESNVVKSWDFDESPELDANITLYAIAYAMKLAKNAGKDRA